jgi:predicted acetylornithine/succinylornithine family transaminase
MSAPSLSELQELERRYAIGTYARAPVQFVRGSGVRLWDSEGNEYLDFLAGISVLNVGHCHPRVVAAVREQVGLLTHATNLFYTAPAMRLSQALSESSLGGKVFLCNSGAEANEAAIKLARRARPGGRIVVVQEAFHGRTYGALSATPQESKQAPFAPLVPGFEVLPKDPGAVAAAVDEDTAAVLLEPIQGEAGVVVPPQGYLAAARAVADEHGALLWLDEVQCGMGRTGKLFAHEWAGITPDVMAVAKGIGGGFPVGCFMATDAAAKGMIAGTHGSTYGGNPLAMAVGNAVLDAVLEPGFLARVAAAGLRLKQELARIKDEHADVVEEVRASGLLAGIKVRPPMGEVVGACLGEKLLTVGAGENVVRLLPPLNVTDAEISEAAQRLSAALKRVAKPAAKPS